jgi:hypothetical protein
MWRFERVAHPAIITLSMLSVSSVSALGCEKPLDLLAISGKQRFACRVQLLPQTNKPDWANRCPVCCRAKLKSAPLPAVPCRPNYASLNSATAVPQRW